MPDRDQTCRAPHCLTAARLCDLDHADPWAADVRTPGGRAVGGPTNLVNLAHVCRTDHGAKDRDGWHVYGFPDGGRSGLRRWLHRRTGLTIDTVPATRRLALGHDPPSTSTGIRAEPGDRARAGPPP